MPFVAAQNVFIKYTLMYYSLFSFDRLVSLYFKKPSRVILLLLEK